MEREESQNGELPQNVSYELKRCGQGNALFDRELGAYKRMFEEDEEMDCSYKFLFPSLLSKGDRFIEPKIAARKVKEEVEESSLHLPTKEANRVDPSVKQGDKARSSEYGKFASEETGKAMEERLEVQNKRKSKRELHQKENGKPSGEKSEPHQRRKGKGLLLHDGVLEKAEPHQRRKGKGLLEHDDVLEKADKAFEEGNDSHMKRKGKEHLIEHDDVRENAVQEKNHPDFEILLNYLKEYEEKADLAKDTPVGKQNLAPDVDKHPGNAQKAGLGKDILVGKPKNVAEKVDMKKRARRGEDGKSKADEQGNIVTKKTRHLLQGEGTGVQKDKKISARDSKKAVTKKTRDEDGKGVLRKRVTRDDDEEGVLGKRVSSEFRNVSRKRKSRSPELRNVIVEELSDEDERVNSRKRLSRGSRKAIMETPTDTDEEVEINMRSPSEFGNDVRKKQSMHEDERVVTEKWSSRDSRNVIIEISTDDDEEVVAKLSPSNCKNVMKKSRINKEEDDDTDYDFDCFADFDDDDDVSGYDDYDDDEKSEDSDMDMMKSAPCHKGPFVPSHKFIDVGENSRVMPTDSKVEFRRELLEVISEPYDKIEYMIIKEEFDSKYYTDRHPELGNELYKCRYNWRKCLALMRGFYFWIQNLRREGAFKPWRDDTCLAVEP